MKRFFFFILIIGMLFVWGTYASAQDETQLELEFPEFASSEDPANFVNNFYLWALGIAGTLAVIRVIYGGVKYVVSAGNVAQQGDARDIITNAVWGLLLLGGAYLILNTINPQLTQLRNPDLTPIPAETRTPDQEVIPQAGVTDEHLIALAERLMIYSYRENGSCGPYSPSKTGAYWNFSDIRSGNMPMVCSNGCTKTAGCLPGNDLVTNQMGVFLDKMVMFYNILEDALRDGEASRYRFLSQLNSSKSIVITSYTGGNHSATSYHYKGRAIDLDIVDSNDASIWNEAVVVLKSLGLTAFCEDPNAPRGQQGKADCKDLVSGGQIISGGHIHVQF